MSTEICFSDQDKFASDGHPPHASDTERYYEPLTKDEISRIKEDRQYRLNKDKENLILFPYDHHDSTYMSEVQPQYQPPLHNYPVQIQAPQHVQLAQAPQLNPGFQIPSTPQLQNSQVPILQGPSSAQVNQNAPINLNLPGPSGSTPPATQAIVISHHCIT